MPWIICSLAGMASSPDQPSTYLTSSVRPMSPPSRPCMTNSPQRSSLHVGMLWMNSSPSRVVLTCHLTQRCCSRFSYSLFCCRSHVLALCSLSTPLPWNCLAPYPSSPVEVADAADSVNACGHQSRRFSYPLLQHFAKTGFANLIFDGLVPFPCTLVSGITQSADG